MRCTIILPQDFTHVLLLQSSDHDSMNESDSDEMPNLMSSEASESEPEGHMSDGGDGAWASEVNQHPVRTCL